MFISQCIFQVHCNLIRTLSLTFLSIGGEEFIENLQLLSSLPFGYTISHDAEIGEHFSDINENHR